MSEKLPTHTFILGCERSGSTWLSNVLDAHPDIEFFMEPFADYAGIFPGFPSRNLYLESHNNTLIDLVKHGYTQLPKMKYPLFYKRGKSVYQKFIDNFFVNCYGIARRTTKFRFPNKIEQFQLLNLNTSKVPIRQQIRKNRLPKVIATKELRLNFKIGLLHKAFPEAKYIIIIRHPGAQIASILKLFKRSSLGELKKSLYSFFDSIYNTNRFDKYHKLQEHFMVNSEMPDMLLLWWLINYEILIEDCKRYGVDFGVVYHEELSESPESEFHRIFTFLGINYPPVVKDYIIASSTKGHTVSSPVDTVRNSARDYKMALSNIEPKMKPKITKLFNSFDVLEEIRRYSVQVK